MSSNAEDDDTHSSSAMLYDVLSSATAGIISRILTHPLDTTKARLQANNTYYRGPIDALLRTYKHEGIRALYRGLNAVIVGGTPGTILYLTGYAYWRDTISSAVSTWNERDDTISTSAAKDNKPSSLSQGEEFTVHFMSGMLAETVCCIIYVPVDVVKERMQVQQQYKQMKNTSDTYYRDSFDALQKILKTEGLRGIYKGYGATLASFGPFSALYFMFYEQCKMRAKEYYIGKHGDNQSSPIVKADGDLPLLYLVACSSAAGALASFLTSPLDMAKLRLQIQRGQAAASNNAGQGQTVYKGMVDCLHSAYNKGGIRGLFRGAGARVIHFAPATTITMTCYEKCKTFYADVLG